ncbi:MAG: hypothetical protein QMC89_03810 [Candidatus Hodarchaeaceae archaeon]|nr:hypothetical protein [Candidatus Hodarchaeaceae archaeon]
MTPSNGAREVEEMFRRLRREFERRRRTEQRKEEETWILGEFGFRSI